MLRTNIGNHLIVMAPRRKTGRQAVCDGTDDIRISIRHHQAHQRVFLEIIPQRPRVIMRISICYEHGIRRVDGTEGTVCTGTVHRHGEHMIQMGIEQPDHRAIGIAGYGIGDLDLAQHLVPRILGSLTDSVKVPVVFFHFSVHVPLGLFRADGGNRHLQFQRGLGICSDGQDCAHIVSCIGLGWIQRMIAFTIPAGHGLDRQTGFHIEIHGILAVAADITAAKSSGEGDTPVFQHFGVHDNIAAGGAAVIAVIQIHDQGQIPFHGQSVTVQTGTHIRRHLCKNAAGTLILGC